MAEHFKLLRQLLVLTRESFEDELRRLVIHHFSNGSISWVIIQGLQFLITSILFAGSQHYTS